MQAVMILPYDDFYLQFFLQEVIKFPQTTQNLLENIYELWGVIFKISRLLTTHTAHNVSKFGLDIQPTWGKLKGTWIVFQNLQVFHVYQQILSYYQAWGSKIATKCRNDLGLQSIKCATVPRLSEVECGPWTRMDHDRLEWNVDFSGPRIGVDHGLECGLQWTIVLGVECGPKLTVDWIMTGVDRGKWTAVDKSTSRLEWNMNWSGQHLDYGLQLTGVDWSGLWIRVYSGLDHCTLWSTDMVCGPWNVDWSRPVDWSGLWIEPWTRVDHRPCKVDWAATMVSHLTYAAPSQHGSITTEGFQRLQAVLNRAHRWGLSGSTHFDLHNLLDAADKRLFKSVLHSSVLHSPNTWQCNCTFTMSFRHLL